MSRYELLIAGIHDTNIFIVRIFLFTLLAVIAYPVLGWTPAWMRKPAQVIYLALMLILFVSVLFLGSGV
jgi:hypothetical protein